MSGENGRGSEMERSLTAQQLHDDTDATSPPATAAAAAAAVDDDDNADDNADDGGMDRYEADVKVKLVEVLPYPFFVILTPLSPCCS